MQQNWLGIDVGGANLKIAGPGGFARSMPFELWKRPAELPAALAALIAEAPAADSIAATMTGELADCYRDKAEGVASICDALTTAAGGKRLLIYTTEGEFVPADQAKQSVTTVAAANWHALAMAVAARFPDRCGVLIDTGSTTTDVIPFGAGRATPQGLTDTDRLRTRELLYFGTGRTPLCAVVDALPYRGASVPVAAELFATTLDAVTVLELQAGDSPTADGRPADRAYSIDRLARMIGADRSTFNHQDAACAARHVVDVLTARICEAVESALASTAGDDALAVVSGAGGWLANAAAGRCGQVEQVIHLREVLNESQSDCAAAEAVAFLAGQGGAS